MKLVGQTVAEVSRVRSDPKKRPVSLIVFKINHSLNITPQLNVFPDMEALHLLCALNQTYLTQGSPAPGAMAQLRAFFLVVLPATFPVSVVISDGHRVGQLQIPGTHSETTTIENMAPGYDWLLQRTALKYILKPKY